MDEADQIIIRELKENARRPIRELAELTGLPSSTVHVRIKKLIAEGIIQSYTIKLAPSGLTIMMMLKSVPDSKLKEDPHLEELYSITGEYAAIAKLNFQDHDEFSKWLHEFRKRNLGEVTYVVTT